MFVSLSVGKSLSLSLHLLSEFPRVGFNARSRGARLMAAVQKCRLQEYQGGFKRSPVPEDKVSWHVEWPDYIPVEYTAPIVLSMPVWADPDFRSVQLPFFFNIRGENVLSVQI